MADGGGGGGGGAPSLDGAADTSLEFGDYRHYPKDNFQNSPAPAARVAEAPAAVLSSSSSSSSSSSLGDGSGGGGGGGGDGSFGSSTTSYISSKGYGWLFEVEDDDDGVDDATTSLLEELDIDVKDILYKLRCVVFPFRLDRDVLMESPDFWGPLAVVCLFSLLSIWGQVSVVSWVITMWLVGSFLVFLLARVLGGDVSFSQTVGVIGYSLLPLVFAAAVLAVPSLLRHRFARFSVAVKALGVVWSTYSAGSLLVTDALAPKRLMLMYPLLLLYTYFVSLHSGV